MDIKETKELVKLMLDCGKIVVDAKADGKISLADAGLLLQLVPTVGPAFDGMDNIPAELKDMDKAEAEELVTYVVANLFVSEEKAVAITEASLRLAIAVYNLYKAITLVKQA